MAHAPILLDCDPGLDDAVALQYLVGSGLWDLKAVTTVEGNVPAPTTYRNGRALARALGIDGDVPVHRGAGRPVSRVHFTAGFHGETGLGEEVLPDSDAPHTTESSAAAMLRLSREYEGELTVVATGPLTNVAIALLEDPDFARRIKRLVFMGGAAHVPGNTSPVAEFNVWADPDAADIVVSSDTDWTMVGLDATHGWRFTWDDLTVLEEAGESLALTHRLMRRYLESYRDLAGQDSCPLHDPLAVGVAADDSFVATEEGTVIVECGSALTRGQTVFLPAGSAAGYDLPAEIARRTERTGRVATGVGPRDFSRDFRETLLRRPMG